MSPSLSPPPASATAGTEVGRLAAQQLGASLATKKGPESAVPSSWPFRLRLRSVAPLTDDALSLRGALARCTGIWLEVELRFNGRALVCAKTGAVAAIDTRFPCRCSGSDLHARGCGCAPSLLPVGSSLCFPRTWLDFRRFNRFEIPPETHICIVLKGSEHTSKKRGGRRGSQGDASGSSGGGDEEGRTLASVSLPFTSFRGEIASGAHALAMVPRGAEGGARGHKGKKDDEESAFSASASASSAAPPTITIRFDLDQFTSSRLGALGTRAPCSLASARAATETWDDAAAAQRRAGAKANASTMVPTAMLTAWLVERAARGSAPRRAAPRADGSGVAATRRRSIVEDGIDPPSEARLRALLKEFETCEYWSSFTVADVPIVWHNRVWLSQVSAREAQQAALPLILLAADWMDRCVQCLPPPPLSTVV